MFLDNDNIICFGKNCYNMYQESIYIYIFNYLYYIFNTIIPLIILSLILLFINFITITYVYFIIKTLISYDANDKDKCKFCYKEKKHNELIYICPEKFYIKQTNESFKKFSSKKQGINTLYICYCKDNINCEINTKTFIANIIPYRQNIKFQYIDIDINSKNTVLYLSETIYLINVLFSNSYLFNNCLINNEDLYSYINTFSTSYECQNEILNILSCWDGWKNVKQYEYNEDTFYKLLPPKYKGYKITYGNFSSKNNNNGFKYIQYSKKNKSVRWIYDKLKHKWIEYKNTNEHSNKIHGYINTGRTSNTIPLCPL